MPLNWMDVAALSFDNLLLLERVQISWLPGFGNLPRDALAIALRANPTVEWFLRHKCPEIGPWLDGVMSEPAGRHEVSVRTAEAAVLVAIEDLIVYVVAPQVYDEQPLLNWDSAELTGLADFTGATVIDVGAGTGRLALTVAPLARVVYAVEPVTNLRHYLRRKARRLGLDNVFVVDGLLTEIPFAAGFCDVAMAGHVFGNNPAAEYQELLRVTRPGAMIILCPGSRDADTREHNFLVSKGFAWSVFDEPRDGPHRKYWQRRPQSGPALRDYPLPDGDASEL